MPFLTPEESIARDKKLKEIALALLEQCKREDWITVHDLDMILEIAKRLIPIQ